MLCVEIKKGTTDLETFRSDRHFCTHVQMYSGIIQEHAHTYSEPSASLAYSKPWNIPVTKHIQTLRCIYNTIFAFPYECAFLL